MNVVLSSMCSLILQFLSAPHVLVPGQSTCEDHVPQLLQQILARWDAAGGTFSSHAKIPAQFSLEFAQGRTVGHLSRE